MVRVFPLVPKAPQIPPLLFPDLFGTAFVHGKAEQFCCFFPLSFLAPSPTMNVPDNPVSLRFYTRTPVFSQLSPKLLPIVP